MRGDIYGDYSLHPLHGRAGWGDTGTEGKCTVTSTSTDQPFIKIADCWVIRKVTNENMMVQQVATIWCFTTHKNIR